MRYAASMSRVQAYRSHEERSARGEARSWLFYLFRMSPIARAIRLTDPVCRPSAAAISDTTRRRASQASRFRSACVHSFGLDDFISIWSNDLDATDIGKST